MFDSRPIYGNIFIIFSKVGPTLGVPEGGGIRPPRPGRRGAGEGRERRLERRGRPGLEKFFHDNFLENPADSCQESAGFTRKLFPGNSR